MYLWRAVDDEGEVLDLVMQRRCDTGAALNRKRHGKFTLAGRPFEFRVKPDFPATVSQECLLVDLVNNLATVGEDPDLVLSRVERKAPSLDARRVAWAPRTTDR